MLQFNNKSFKEGQFVKYSFYEMGIPLFYGKITLVDGEWHIEHSNKVTIKLDKRIKYIDLVHFDNEK